MHHNAGEYDTVIDFNPYFLCLGPTQVDSVAEEEEVTKELATIDANGPIDGIKEVNTYRRLYYKRV